jgi:hypothetical protein
MYFNDIIEIVKVLLVIQLRGDIKSMKVYRRTTMPSDGNKKRLAKIVTKIFILHFF